MGCEEEDTASEAACRSFTDGSGSAGAASHQRRTRRALLGAVSVLGRRCSFLAVVTIPSTDVELRLGETVFLRQGRKNRGESPQFSAVLSATISQSLLVLSQPHLIRQAPFYDFSETCSLSLLPPNRRVSSERTS